MDKPKILLVEDDLFLREIYLESLSSANYTIDSASNGTDAYTKMSEGGWDLVLLDIMLPDMTGLEVMRKIKSEHPEPVAKKIIFMTNMDTGPELDEAKLLGNGYITKSEMTPDQLIQKVNELLSEVPTSSAE